MFVRVQEVREQLRGYMNNNNDKEKEYKDLEEQLEEIEEDILPNSISNSSCELCGARMTINEVDAFDTMCEECAWESTSGLIDDDEEKEL